MPAGSRSSTPSALVLYAKRPFGGPQQVLSYLANYTHRVALSNRRIVAVDAQHQSVTFTYRDYRHGSQRKELNLSALEFIRRFSLHILPTVSDGVGKRSSQSLMRKNVGRFLILQTSTHLMAKTNQ